MPAKKITNRLETPARADVLLANKFPEYSRSALAKLFDLGNITKDNKAIEAGDKIKPGGSFNADITPITKPAEKIDLPIIYEDENVVVIDKPVGIISHARGKYWDEPSVASFIRGRVADLSGERAGIVHRLDRATSGVMICAKNPLALKFLQKQFSTRKVEKTYIAIVEGKLKENSAVIDVPIDRDPKNPKTFKPDQNGKNAITSYNVLKENEHRSLLLLKPFTGRTHQLRVHLKYLNHPIIGDELYKGKKGSRLMLHAYSLRLKLPKVGEKIFYSPLPKEFFKELGYEITIQ